MNLAMKNILIVVTILISLVTIQTCARKTEVDPAMKTKAANINQEGLDLYAKGNYKEAMEKFREAAQINPNEAEYPNNIGNCHLQQKQLNEALEQFEKAKSIRDDIPLYYYNSGFALLTMGKDPDALKNFEKAASLDAQYFMAWQYIGIINFNNKKFTQAEKAWRTALALRTDPEIENNIGMIYLENGKLGEAEQQFKRAASIDPRYPLPHYNLGVLYQKQKKYAAADASYSEAIKRNPQNYTYYYNRAIVLTELGKKKEAIDSLETFLKYCPKELAGPIDGAKRRLQELRGTK